MSSIQADDNLCARCDQSPDCECIMMPLCEAEAGKNVKVACVNGGRGLCARMAALGIYPGVEMRLICGGCVRVNGGGVLSLGKDISGKILVTPQEKGKEKAIRN